MTKIVKTAAYLPEKIITNQDLEKVLETSDEWIKSRTGIKERRKETEKSIVEMALKVASQLVSEKEAPTLDFIIVASFTPEQSMPSIASQVQGGLGATNAYAFDINAACSGFVYALNLAHHLLLGEGKKGLVIGVEKTSLIIDETDRKTAVLFGDGAAGVLVEKSSQLFSALLKNQGTKGNALQAGFKGNKEYLTMDGKEIFSFVLHEVKENIVEILEKNQTSFLKVDYLLAHQANARLIQKLAAKLQIPIEKCLMNLQYYGNTSAASIPLLLHEAVEKKQIILGSRQKILLSGFGGGLTYGSILMES